MRVTRVTRVTIAVIDHGDGVGTQELLKALEDGQSVKIVSDLDERIVPDGITPLTDGVSATEAINRYLDEQPKVLGHVQDPNSCASIKTAEKKVYSWGATRHGW